MTQNYVGLITTTNMLLSATLKMVWSGVLIKINQIKVIYIKDFATKLGNVVCFN